MGQVHLVPGLPMTRKRMLQDSAIPLVGLQDAALMQLASAGELGCSGSREILMVGMKRKFEEDNVVDHQKHNKIAAEEGEADKVATEERRSSNVAAEEEGWSKIFVVEGQPHVPKDDDSGTLSISED